MKFDIITFSLLFIIFILGNIELSSSNIVNKEKRDSYNACVRLREKAPYFNLKCENLLDEIEDNKEVENNSKIKTLSVDKSSTRKVNKIEEIKLRNLIRKLTNQNKLGID